MTSPDLALIGAGYWGKNLARNFNALGHLHTICDLSPDVLARHRKHYPDLYFVTDASSVLNNPEVQRVAIATGAESHYYLAKEALLAGKDVYVEKPFCLSSKEGQELVEMAAERGLVLMVGHLLHYHPGVQALFRLVDERAIGEIEYIVANRLHVAPVMCKEGALWDLAPHDISVILELCRPATLQNVDYCSGYEADIGLIALEFSCGTRAHIHISRINPFKEQKLTVVGAKATAVFDDTAPWEEKLTIYRKGTSQVAERVSLTKNEPLFEECAHFLDCCERRCTPLTSGEEGLQVIQALEEAQGSRLEKRLDIAIASLQT